MKKLISMMLMLCAIVTFSACSSDDDGPTNPVTNPVVPTSAKIGAEVTVQGSGFATGQTLLLQPAEVLPMATRLYWAMQPTRLLQVQLQLMA